jgi:hypothetical protein
VLPSDRIPDIHRDPVDPLPLWEYGTFLRDVDHELVDRILEHVGTGKNSPLAVMEVRYHRGAYSRDPELPNAIGGRQEPFTFLVVGHPDDLVLATGEVEAAAFALRDVVEPWQGAEVNYNWANPLTSDTFENRLWAPPVRDRLKAIRKHYDPDGIFEFGF